MERHRRKPETLNPKSSRKKSTKHNSWIIYACCRATWVLWCLVSYQGTFSDYFLKRLHLCIYWLFACTNAGRYSEKSEFRNFSLHTCTRTLTFDFVLFFFLPSLGAQHDLPCGFEDDYEAYFFVKTKIRVLFDLCRTGTIYWLFRIMRVRRWRRDRHSQTNFFQ